MFHNVNAVIVIADKIIISCGGGGSLFLSGIHTPQKMDLVNILICCVSDM